MVIDVISHDESPTEISPMEAADIEAQQMAGRIERLLNCGADSLSDPHIVGCVVLCTCNRTPDAMITALCNNRSLRSCRESLEEAGHHWRLPSGAFIFVDPEQYNIVMRALGSTMIKAYHIVIASDLEYLLEESIAEIGQGAWMKAREPLRLRNVSPQGSICSDASSIRESPSTPRTWAFAVDGTESVFEYKRSFLCMAPRRRNPDSVCGSTTEAERGAAINPRRALAWAGSF
jgi:hypothetical protein